MQAKVADPDETENCHARLSILGLAGATDELELVTVGWEETGELDHRRDGVDVAVRDEVGLGEADAEADGVVLGFTHTVGKERISLLTGVPVQEEPSYTFVVYVAFAAEQVSLTDDDVLPRLSQKTV